MLCCTSSAALQSAFHRRGKPLCSPRCPPRRSRCEDIGEQSRARGAARQLEPARGGGGGRAGVHPRGILKAIETSDSEIIPDLSGSDRIVMQSHTDLLSIQSCRAPEMLFSTVHTVKHMSNATCSSHSKGSTACSSGLSQRFEQCFLAYAIRIIQTERTVHPKGERSSHTRGGANSLQPCLYF